MPKADAAQAAKPAAQAKSAGVRITYTPGQGDPAEVMWNRLKFPANVPVLVNDQRLVEKAKNNAWFKVEGEKQAEKGYDPAADQPTNATEYRAYAITWFKTVKSSAEMTSRWNAEEAMRVELDLGPDDIDYIARHYDPRLEQLRKMEAAGEAQ